MKPKIIQDFPSQIRTTGQRIRSRRRHGEGLLSKTISKPLKQGMEL